MNELTIALNQKSTKPLYEQIYEYIKSEIQCERLSYNDKLPSSRALAKHLQISRSTVVLAYEQLVAEGYIESLDRKGYFVAQIQDLYRIRNIQESFFENGQKGYEFDYDFSSSGVDLDNFPFNAWRKISKNALLDDNKELFKLGSPNGEPDLRMTIAKYLHQSRGINCSYEQIVLGAGNDYLLMLLNIILDKDYIIAMENPTYIRAYNTFCNLKYRIELVSCDEYGINIKELEKTKANLVYTMPSHQFPLGIVMPVKRRMELLNWANCKDDRYILEDDYDSEFRYKGKPIPAMQGLDDNGKIIYIGTFSKSIAPAIRVSYMVLPKELMKKYYNNQGFYASTVTRIDQSIINSFIIEGYYERHLNKMRGIYKRKRDILLQELQSLEGKCDITGEDAGVHILLHFPKEIKEEELIQAAQCQKVKVYGLSKYYINKEAIKETIIMLGYATLTEEDIAEGIKRLKIAWKGII